MVDSISSSSNYSEILQSVLMSSQNEDIAKLAQDVMLIQTEALITASVLNMTDEGYVIDAILPENSTVSYHV